jgi:pimeloyl-ACP methyl ester carboxylesterase
MPKAQIDGFQLYYESEGQGEALVLIPGFAAGRWIWFKQVATLSQKFRVITFDPRGVSRSDSPDGPQSISLIADDIAVLLSTLGIASAHVLGASFGGFVAQEFALSHPLLTRKLVLCCTSFGGPNHVLPTAETLLALASTKGLNTADRMRENLLLAFSPDYVRNQPDEVDMVVQLRANNEVPEDVYLRQLNAAVTFNAEGRLEGIKSPTLVVSGDADIIVPVQNSHNLAARIHGARLRIVEGGSHTFFIERAEEFNRMVVGFLEE